jgi:acetylornithine/succinyldiaminopimelate/putrescine aminotransferase
MENLKLLFPFNQNTSHQNARKIDRYVQYGFIENEKSILDLSLGNCGCFMLGFNRLDIIDYVAEQMKKNPFVSGEYMTTNQAVINLTEKLYDLSGGYRTIFSLSGSDAIEGAVRLAQLYNGRNKFLGFVNSYHGCTYMSSSISDSKYITNVFGKDTKCITSDYNLESITDDLCAVVIETSSWQNGLRDPGVEFWEGLRKICTDKNIVLIVDDIAMCGGKTGKFFGFTDIVEPDIVCVGKAFSGGYYPLSACLINESLNNVIKDNFLPHGFTYSFSLSGIYSTLKYIDILESENLLHNYDSVLSQSLLLMNKLVGSGIVRSFRNHGLMFDLDITPTTEQDFYNNGLNIGVWNSDESRLMLVIPLIADTSYFNQLEERLVSALHVA